MRPATSLQNPSAETAFQSLPFGFAYWIEQVAGLILGVPVESAHRRSQGIIRRIRWFGGEARGCDFRCLPSKKNLARLLQLGVVEAIRLQHEVHHALDFRVAQAAVAEVLGPIAPSAGIILVHGVPLDLARLQRLHHHVAEALLGPGRQDLLVRGILVERHPALTGHFPRPRRPRTQRLERIQVLHRLATKNNLLVVAARQHQEHFHGKGCRVYAANLHRDVSLKQRKENQQRRRQCRRCRLAC